jgi:low temperature requirement protein LtrA
VPHRRPSISAVDFGRLRGRAVVRDGDEEHRASTPLELFFDLTYVVGVGQAAEALHHEVVSGHVRHGVIGFAGVFFAVWWGWMNFTWFASAHDSDDVAHRLLTFVQMAGALVLACGVSQAVVQGDFLVATIGYVIMRIGLVGGWLRVARDHPDQRPRALRYVAGLVVLQVLWLTRLALPTTLATISFVVLAVCELLVPYIAEHAGGTAIFHSGHIEERYGLFTLIVLGESILADTVGFQAAVDGGLTAPLLALGVSGLLIAFAAWWIYFDHPGHLTPTPAQSFRWGYAHVIVFASLAALGAGIDVATDALTGHGSTRVAALMVAWPVAGFLLGLATIMAITGTRVLSGFVLPKLAGAAVLVVLGLVAPVVPTLIGSALVIVFLASSMVVTDPAHNDRALAPVARRY